MEGDLIIMRRKNIFRYYRNKIVFPGGEVYLDCFDSLDFISRCNMLKIPIYRIEIVKITKNTTVSSLEKIIDYDDQREVYCSAEEFIRDQMDDEWNYATIVTG